MPGMTGSPERVPDRWRAATLGLLVCASLSLWPAQARAQVLCRTEPARALPSPLPQRLAYACGVICLVLSFGAGWRAGQVDDQRSALAARI